MSVPVFFLEGRRAFLKPCGVSINVIIVLNDVALLVSWSKKNINKQKKKSRNALF